MPDQEAPSVAELISNPIVVQALEDAWRDSLPADRFLRHEEGGWIYVNRSTGSLIIQSAASGLRAALDLGSPPAIQGATIVATFHTHPNPISEGWFPGPSFDDTESAWVLGVPCIIRTDDGIYTTGPTARRGGLDGKSGFPGEEAS